MTSEVIGEVTGELASDVADVRPGEELDWPALERHLRARLPHLDGEFSVQQFPNGSANLTYLVHFGEDALVVRRPPFGTIAAGAHDMLREYTCLLYTSDAADE